MLITALLPAMLLAGCTEQSFFVGEEPVDPGLKDGSIQGRVCDPSGRTWLADAMVYTHLFTRDGQLYDTLIGYSDRDGYWYIDELPPEYEYSVYVQYGDTLIEEHTVWVGDDDHIQLEEPDCFDPLQLDVAVITGDYDDFQDVLGNMGFANYRLIDGLIETDIRDFLLDPEAMAQFDIIFFNGGHVEENVIYDLDGDDAGARHEVILRNIREYVDNGGSIYASDWAYDVVEIGWPERIDFVGRDETPDEAQVGEYDLVSAEVSDVGMADWLGSERIGIEYDLPVWPPVESVDPAVTTHLRGNVSYRVGTESYQLAGVPLLVSFGSGEGKVAFSTFRVAKNGTTDMMLVLQYMMYNL